MRPTMFNPLRQPHEGRSRPKRLYISSSWYHCSRNRSGRVYLPKITRTCLVTFVQRILDMMDHPHAARVRVGQCQFGVGIVRRRDSGRPLTKPTGFISNAPKLVEYLGRVCGGNVCVCWGGGGRARDQLVMGTRQHAERPRGMR